MIKILGPVYISAEDWPEWRRTMQPWLRILKVATVFNLLMAWAALLVWIRYHVSLE